MEERLELVQIGRRIRSRLFACIVGSRALVGQDGIEVRQEVVVCILRRPPLQGVVIEIRQHIRRRVPAILGITHGYVPLVEEGTIPAGIGNRQKTISIVPKAAMQ